MATVFLLSFAPVHRVVDLATVVIAFDGESSLGCGCFRRIDELMIDIKRMYVVPTFRNRGIATAILEELEKRGCELACHRIQLETGILQPEAVRLYEKSGYTRIENYEPYVGIAESIGMEKKSGNEDQPRDSVRKYELETLVFVQ